MRADPVVQDYCLGCHSENGIAPTAGAMLVLRSTTDTTYLDFNYTNFLQLAEDRSPQHILSKVQGVAHGGGAVLDTFSAEFKVLSDFLLALGSSERCATAPKGNPEQLTADAYWAGVETMAPAEVFRKASVVLARRVPTAAEVANVRDGTLTLNDAIAGLLDGDGFHRFLVTGANDQLHTDAFFNGLFPVGYDSGFYPRKGEILGRAFQNSELSLEDFKREFFSGYQRQMYFGTAKEPIELIAYIVENDLPYTAVVTADFTMVTPITNDILQAGAEWDQDVKYDGRYTKFHQTFKPGVDRGQMSAQPSEPYVEVFPGTAYYPGGFESWERSHAGVLSTMAYLRRYPTTPTNRNRARARWAYQFFLGVDIEASAARTIDPAAIADRDNPTLNNPACTVCHKALDPVAGAFQNYGPNGEYRINEFTDSLPGEYKYPWIFGLPPTDYQAGDTWFRDMRKPGFDGQEAPEGLDSLQWLGEVIAQDPRFPLGTVEFWWPAVMGAEVLSVPEDPSLPNYERELQAFNLQRYEIARLAAIFVEGSKRLKPLLHAMVTSPWFVARGLLESAEFPDVLAAAGLGSRRLLTPEELNDKTASLFGFRLWEYDEGLATGNAPDPFNFIKNRGNIALGGIDSFLVTQRSRNFSALQYAVIDQHASGVACTFMALEAETKQEYRQVLDKIDLTVPPSDNADLRSTIASLYDRLHGRVVDPSSEQVALVLDLLVEAYAVPDDQYGCFQRRDPRQFAELKEAAEQAGVLLPANRYISPEERANAYAWQLVFDFMISHYDYITE